MQKKIVKHSHDGNTNILTNFRTIRTTPKIDPILNLQPLNQPLKIELEEINSTPDFANVDEKTNNYASDILMSPNPPEKKGLNKLRFIVQGIMRKNQEMKRENVIFFSNFCRNFLFQVRKNEIESRKKGNAYERVFNKTSFR